MALSCSASARNEEELNALSILRFNCQQLAPEII